MHVLLWIVQAALAAMFGMVGVAKAVRPKERLAAKLAWANDFSAGTLKLIGAAELLGALGLVLPGVTGTATALTPLAATGLAVVMVLAALTHARRREYGSVAVNAVLFLLAAAVAWGRFGPYAL